MFFGGGLPFFLSGGSARACRCGNRMPRVPILSAYRYFLEQMGARIFRTTSEPERAPSISRSRPVQSHRPSATSGGPGSRRGSARSCSRPARLHPVRPVQWLQMGRTTGDSVAQAVPTGRSEQSEPCFWSMKKPSSCSPSSFTVACVTRHVVFWVKAAAGVLATAMMSVARPSAVPARHPFGDVLQWRWLLSFRLFHAVPRRFHRLPSRTPPGATGVPYRLT